MSNNDNKNRSAFGVMAGLTGMVKPLLGFMIIAILIGTAGNLFATFITVLGGYGILKAAGMSLDVSFMVIFLLIAVFAVGRGIFRYSEQACNHYIAFKLLARIRHKVFASLRRLAPAKLEGKDKGNLISIITSDIEQLEVFYAHTISPIVIAVMYSVVMCLFMGKMFLPAGFIAAFFYLLIGVVIPISNHNRGKNDGNTYRSEYGKLNTQVLDNLYGMEEILQYAQDKNRIIQMEKESSRLNDINLRLKKNEGTQRAITDTVILVAGFTVFVAGSYGTVHGNEDFTSVVLCVIALMSSFGPVAALSALSNNLTQTLASGNRVLNLLNEEPEICDITSGTDVIENNMKASNVTFGYEDDNIILEDFNISIKPGEIHGILGASGSGKSTFLKLLMRFYQVDEGSITYGDTDINQINTEALRKKTAYVTQETFLFSDTIENNIKLANQNATKEMVVEAAKRASIHEFISSLPKGYDTCLAELGGSVSGGEGQRIGLARAFLHQPDILLLDEPTSNIDSLNEGIILKSIYEEKEEKTIVLVSHRKSTMGIANKVTSL